MNNGELRKRNIEYLRGYRVGYKEGYKYARIEFERPTGEWIVSGYIDTCRGYVAECSVCKEVTVGGGDFCKNCGTKMTGGVRNNEAN